MTSSLSQRDLLLLPQTGTTEFLLQMFSDQGQQMIMRAKSTNSPTRVTSTHMPAALCEKLIQLCNQYHIIISDNGNSMDCRMKRRNLWIEISKQLNNEFNVDFTADQYKKKYQNLKTALKTKMQNLNTHQRTVSPESRREVDMKPEMVMFQPATSPVRPTPQPVLQPPQLASLFDGKSSLLALAVQAAHQQLQAQAVSSAAAAAGSHLTSEALQVNVGHEGGSLDMHSFLSGMTGQERPPSVDPQCSMGSMSNLGHLGGGLLERVVDHEGVGMSAESAVGSASASDHQAPLSNLPHISPSQDEDPARMFCLALADPMRRIREGNRLLYIQLKKTITTMVLDAEMETYRTDPDTENERMD